MPHLIAELHASFTQIRETGAGHHPELTTSNSTNNQFDLLD